MSQLWAESGKDRTSTNTRAAILRYLEAVPEDLAARRDAWQRVADISRKERDWMSFVNASVQIAELPDSNLHVISNTVNTFNSVKKEFDIEPEQIKAFARRLAAAMEARITEANATDCSRLAWLHMLTGSQSRAYEVVQIGLREDPENEHCRKLEGRLANEIAQAAGRLF